MSSERFHARVGAARLIGVATLANSIHRFNKLGNDGTAKGNVEPRRGAAVLGVVYDVTDSQIETLDEIESGYDRAIALVDLGGRQLQATTYRAIVTADDLTPTAAYLGHYAAGITEHDLRAAYLREILQRAKIAVVDPEAW